MATNPAGQFASNMLRRTILVLQLFGLLATCCCTVLHRNAFERSSMSIDCSQTRNSTACATRMQEIEGRRNQTVYRVARTIGGEVSSDGAAGVEEATGRRKKGKGYWQMLLYFLGASKLTMLYMIVNAIAAIAGKALIVAKVALAIATAVALKKASEHKEKVSYEIIKHPYHSYEHTHSASIDYDHGGFGENDFSYRKRRRIYQ